MDEKGEIWKKLIKRLSVAKQQQTLQKRRSKILAEKAIRSRVARCGTPRIKGPLAHALKEPPNYSLHPTHPAPRNVMAVAIR
jgi:hypothetical protein